ncbi:hypothetical protein D3C80_1939100 [compost metagenome]
MLNAFNPDVVISENFKPGEIAVFERNSGAINSIIRGNKRVQLSQSKEGHDGTR